MGARVSDRRRIALALVGCGAVAERFHAPALRRIEEIDVRAVVDVDPARRQRMRRRFPRAEAYGSVAELPGDIEAALVAVPNALHAPLCIELFQRGVHVLCEKPMATTVDDCERMLKAATEAGAALSVGHHKRFLPSVRKAKQLLEEGRLGRIRRVTASMGLPWSWPSRSGFYSDRARAGGGVLLDTGIHLIDLVLWLLGPIRDLRYYGLPTGQPIEQEAKLEVWMACGATGVLRCSHRRVLPNLFRVEGEKGFLEFDTYDYPVLKVFIAGTALARERGSVALTWPRGNPFREQLQQFLRRVHGEEGSGVNAEEAMEAVSVATAAYAGQAGST